MIVIPESALPQGPTREVHIPRTFHYCWFGGAPKPPLVQRCIESWRLYMPEWDIIEWNESNYDVGASDYTRQAYGGGYWAFVSDYARFDVLSRYGGIYLDTDVELLQAIPEWVLRDSAFTGMDPAGIVNPGQIMGCVAGTPLLEELLTSYRNAQFVMDGRPVLTTVNHRTTEVLERHGYLREDVTQRVAGVTIHSSEYFCGYDTDVHEPAITERTISMHHGSHSWGSRGMRLRRTIQGFAKRIIGVPGYRKLLAIKRRLFGIHGAVPPSVPEQGEELEP